MNSSAAGTNISSSEVTNIEPTGFWLLVNEKEYFVPYTEYPAFLEATIAQILNLVSLSPGQLHWPDLDVDIEVDALQRPEIYTLQYQ